MSFERVKTYLQERGMAGRAQEFDVSSATVPLAALALGVPEAMIAKTLSFRAAQAPAMLVVTAGDARIDNAKFKACFGIKAKMLSAEEALLYTGFEVGGVCPFDIKAEVKIYLDESLRRFLTVYPACGSANSAVRLHPDELQALCGGEWVNVCKTIPLTFDF